MGYEIKSQFLRSSLILALLVSVALPTSHLLGQLTPGQERGRQIYTKGTSPSGQEITAALGNQDAEVPASVLACVNCHGPDGRGKPEGGVTPSNITWEALTKPYGVTHPSGRQHPPYMERFLRRAITMGIDPAGNKLHAAMPRYRISHQDLADLIAYLKLIGKSLVPGVTETTLRIGVILPPSARQPEMSQAVRAVVSAYFDEVNRGGGIYGRRIELRFVAAPDSSEERTKTIRTFLDAEPIFALMAGFLVAADDVIASLAEEKETPLIGAFAPDPQTEAANRYTFYLYGSLSEQARALAVFAAEWLPTKNPPTAIIYPDEQTARTVAETIKTQCRKSGWDRVEQVAVSHKQFDPERLTEKLSESATELVFFLGPSPAQLVFLQKAQKRTWTPMFFVPGSLVGKEIYDAPLGFDGRIFVSYPTLPSDQTPVGIAEYQALAKAYQLSPHSLATQLSALASAKILIEGLKRAGKEISREKLIETLEKLYEFPTGFTPAVTYGTNRRVGSPGAHIVSIGLRAKRVIPVRRLIEPK